MSQRIFSGVQPSGNLHIGNYLGAIKNWVKLQDEPAPTRGDASSTRLDSTRQARGGFESIFCVVDLHAITISQDPKELKQKTLEVVKAYIAAGIDPKKSTIFVQSQVPEHSELCWILNTITKISEMERMTQFKDKSENTEGIGMGLFDYPVLMAADILLYDTQLVPVGEDQLQHVELARTLAKRFNQKFGETFVVPEAKLVKEGARIMGLDDPTKKMSKSAPSEYNYIALTDDAETIRKKIKKAVTDSGSEIVYQDDKPALKNLINIYSLFSEKTPQEIEKMYQGKGYSDFKTDLAEEIIKGLKPIQEKMQKLTDADVLTIIEKGSKNARSLASAKMAQIREKMGLLT